MDTHVPAATLAVLHALSVPDDVPMAACEVNEITQRITPATLPPDVMAIIEAKMHALDIPAID